MHKRKIKQKDWIFSETDFKQAGTASVVMIQLFLVSSKGKSLGKKGDLTGDRGYHLQHFLCK